MTSSCQLNQMIVYQGRKIFLPVRDTLNRQEKPRILIFFPFDYLSHEKFDVLCMLWEEPHPHLDVQINDLI